MASTVFILNGPNLNLLGTREPEIYGTTTLADIKKMSVEAAKTHGLGIDFRQSNSEGELVDWIQEARTKAAAVIINGAAYTHTSIAIPDALSAFEGPIVEVHISNIHQRESFRHHSYISAIADGVIVGLGAEGYLLAIAAVAKTLAD
jgi:3-dehydroquinate dehydratase II